MSAQTILFVIFGLVAANLVFKIIKNRGWKGAMFGAPLGTLTSEMELSSRGLTTTKLKVHVLDPRDPGEGPHVGVEVIHSTFGSWETKPVSLTRTEAWWFAEELSRAAEASESASGSGNGSVAG